MEGPEVESDVLTGEVISIVRAPADWPLVGDVMTNADHSYDPLVEARLRQGGAVGWHTARGFCGYVWFQEGLWYERVVVRHEPVASYRAEDLKTLMITVNNQHGWA